MRLKDIIAKAKYIQFPYVNKEYKSIYTLREPIKLPILSDKKILYTGMPKDNGHHYTTWYTYNYVLPVLDKLFNFNYSMDDFDLVDMNNGIYDLSYIRPKNNDNYTITCFNNGETFTGEYEILFNPVFFKNPLYRELYRYPHKCSRIVNNTSKSNRILMITGDSQMIPSIAPLAHYFKEVWYFDNRTGYLKNKKTKEYEFHKEMFKSFCKNYRGVVFTDVLIECYCRDLNWYEYWNLQ